MSIFKEIENRLENLFEGFFNKKFRSSLQPVELARKLTAEMDRKRQISVAHVYIPNIFTVSLSESDLEQIEGFQESLRNELSEYLAAHAKSKNYHLAGDFKILFSSDSMLKSGDCRIISRLEEDLSDLSAGDTQMMSTVVADLPPAPAKAYLSSESLGLNYMLKEEAITIGRREDNDLVINKPGVSRYHARLEREAGTYRLIDLDSTNGTLINGEEVGQVALSDGDEIAFGEVSLVFRLKID